MPTTTDVVVLVTIAAGTGAAAVIDLRTRRVPNALTMAMAAIGILIAAMGLGRVGIGASLAGCALGALLMMPGHLFGGTGAGDVKLLAAAGATLGPTLTVKAFVATVIAGGVLALVVAVRRGRLRRTLSATRRLAVGHPDSAGIKHPSEDNRFAYAPAIAVGATLAALIR